MKESALVMRIEKEMTLQRLLDTGRPVNINTYSSERSILAALHSRTDFYIPH